MPDSEAWERKPKETAQSFEAFRMYRDLGVDRSLRLVAERIGKRVELLKRWSARHAWVRRAHAFDAYRDRVQSAELELARKKMMERHVRAAVGLFARGLEALQKVDPEMLTTSDVPRWIGEAIKLERQARGVDELPKDASTKVAYLTLWERIGGPEAEAAAATA